MSFSKPMSNNLHFTITIESVTSSWTLQHTSTNHEISTAMHTHIVQQLTKAVTTAEVAYTAFYVHIKQYFFNSQFLGQPGWVGTRLSNRPYYAALLLKEGPHIASHSVCLSVCLSVCPVIVTERHVAPPSELQWRTRWGPHIVRPSQPHKLVFFCSMKIMEVSAVRCPSCHPTNTVKYQRHINPWKQYSPRVTRW